MTHSNRSIVIYGAGFSAHLTAAAFANSLGAAARLILVEPEQAVESDILYGSVSSPSAYNFLASAGLDEPTLMRRSQSAFSFGTQFRDWPSQSSSWMQTFHLPLPVLSGVPIQHFLTARDASLEPFLISAQAAVLGVFAHPPEDARHPLSRAEYGYQFDVSEWRQLLSDQNARRNIQRVTERVDHIEVTEGKIAALLFDSGRKIEADLFVDCSEADRALMSALGAAFVAGRTLRASVRMSEAAQAGAACRSLTATEQGWIARTPLQNGVQTLSITHPDATHDAASHEFLTGKLREAWIGNCVAIGRSAWGVEPITPAPMMLLQRDIERTLDLIPVTESCDVESREYNRRFEDDITHANAFQRALFVVEDAPATEYWQAAISEPIDEKLDRKLTQFRSRGILVRYDLEPFNEEDWVILLNGMGVKPSRYDRQVDGVDPSAITEQLDGLQRVIAQITAKMPPHHVYMANLKKYLEKQNHG